MHQCEPFLLWLGHAGEGRDFRQLFDAGIKALVDLAAEEPPGQPPRELICCRFPLLDGAGNRADLLFLAVTTVATLLKMRVPTLICCSAGVSRAPAIAAAAQAMAHQESPDAWLEALARHHPIDVSPGLWAEIKALLQTVRPG